MACTIRHTILSTLAAVSFTHAVFGQETQTFDSEASAASSGWIANEEGQNPDRDCDGCETDLGWKNSNFAGGVAAGEGGGLTHRSGGLPIGFYADTTIGELTLDMLDLKYNAVSRTYQASLQLKSTGGVFIVDDLGRQAEPPQALINRWIVPMESGFDILALQSGEKFVVPFDTLVIFSTNFLPSEMFDGAALRRIAYKVKVDGPTQDQFLQIFMRVCQAKKIPVDERSVVHLLKNRYPEVDHVYANFHSAFLLDQILSICGYEGIPPQMTTDLIDRAWANLFVDET